MKEQLVYENIFDAIFDDQSEAADMKFRSDLMIIIRQLQTKGTKYCKL